MDGDKLIIWYFDRGLNLIVDEFWKSIYEWVVRILIVEVLKISILLMNVSFIFVLLFFEVIFY